MAIHYGDGSNSEDADGRRIQTIRAATNSSTVRSNNAGWIALNGLTLNITPKQNNHKILITAQVPVDVYFSGQGGAGAEIYIARIIGGNSTAVWESMVMGRSNNNHNVMASVSILHLDNPTTIAQITYTLYGRETHGNTQSTFNGQANASNYGSGQAYTASLIATELAA